MTGPDGQNPKAIEEWSLRLFKVVLASMIGLRCTTQDWIFARMGDNVNLEKSLYDALVSGGGGCGLSAVRP